MTVAATESPVAVGPVNQGRLMFRANLERVRDDEMSGRVVVFARASDFGGLMVGQPMRFTARIGRPTRHDLTVAVLTATGRPRLGAASAVQRAAARGARPVRGRGPRGAARRAGRDAARPGARRHLGGDAQTRGEFRAAGMTHLTAVSGANVTIVCAAVLFCGAG